MPHGTATLEPEAEGRDEAESLLQSEFWASFKAEFGWISLRLRISYSGSSRPLLVLVRRLAAGRCFAYVPHGPEGEVPQAERAPFLAELSELLRPRLPPGCLFIRYDPPWFVAEPKRGEEGGLGPSEVEALRPDISGALRRAAADVQPPDTVLLDLRPGEEELLSAMKPKWRYNVRLAQKRGVSVEAGGTEAVPEFYELYRATSLRDRIALHPERYYARLFALAAERQAAGMPGAPDLRLWTARHEGRALAAIVTAFRGGRAVYLYGASSDEGRNLMPAYALQWAAMLAAKAAGCVEYDLFGIPPAEDPSHPMAGLYRFKTGFGGQIVHRAGSWDYPLRRPVYAAFRAAERARAWWFKDFKKRLKRPGR
jgi:lipid II:glycine glycyltransferase (peptidoglycan interpeptide bridge formation enzyme)